MTCQPALRARPAPSWPAAAILPVLTSCIATTVAPPVSEHQLAADAWHAERIEDLRAPYGWLSLVGLAWLNEGPNVIGRGEGADVRYDGFSVDRVGVLTLEDGQLSFDPEPGVQVEGLTDDGVIETDRAGDPTVLRAGEVHFHVIERGGRLGVRIKDPRAATRTDFAGVDRFVVDSTWVIDAEFTPSDERVAFDTVIGTPVVDRAVGRVRFERDGVAVDAVLTPDGKGGGYLRFTDATAGVSTYPIGRYLHVPGPLNRPGPVRLDFNRAYNPPCAFTSFATCTLAPESNRFPFLVGAGELRPTR